jgi:cystathionine beta-synthase
MREKGFDQLPVLTTDGKKLAGLITLGNVLSWISRGRAAGKSPVSDVMFDFAKLPEVVTDPRDVVPDAAGQSNIKRRRFFEITLDTPLSVLNRFFEWNSAAIVTERDEQGTIKPVAVATKVDLLTWLLHQNKS